MNRVTPTAVLAVLTALACTAGWWLLREPRDSRVLGVSSSEQAEESERNAIAPLSPLPLSRRAVPGGSAANEEIVSPSVLSPQATLRLINSDGDPMAGVQFWRDIKPLTGHDATPPEGAASTSEDGTLRLPTLTRNEWLWFALEEGLAMAVPSEIARRSTTIQAPPIGEYAIEIIGLPPGATWSIAAVPALIEPDGEFEYGRRRVDPVKFRTDGVLMHRREVRRGGSEDPSSCTLRLVEDLAYAFFLEADEYPVEPSYFELARPRDVVATAGAPWPAIAFEVLEVDGATPSSVSGSAGVTEPRQQNARYQAFESGRGKFMRVEAGLRLGVALKDGEVHTRLLVPGDLLGSAPISFVRGSGQAAESVLRAPASWPGVRIAMVGPRGLEPVDPFEQLYPFGSRPRVAGWWHDGDVVIQTTPLGTRREGRVVLIGDYGREFGVEEDGAIVPWASEPLEPVDLHAMAEEIGRTTSDEGVILIEFQVRHPELELGESSSWITLEVLRLHKVKDIGWRLSRTNSIDDHEPIGPPHQLFAPRGAAARLLVRPPDSDATALPLSFVE